jgi:hypothetical protein
MLVPSIEKKWIWDNEKNELVCKTEVFCLLMGTEGSIFLEEGPLYVEKSEEIVSTYNLLKERLQKRVGTFVSSKSE